MTQDVTELNRIRTALETISIALTVLAMNQTGAEDADERKRHDIATQKGLEILLKRIEEA
jgi:hypothetical protein